MSAASRCDRGVRVAWSLLLEGDLPVSRVRTLTRAAAKTARIVWPSRRCAEVGPLLERQSPAWLQSRRPSRSRTRRWTALRRQARGEVVAAADRASSLRFGEPLPDATPADSFVLAGHQPELFHPGVWVKNFALFGLARQHGATPLNLIVDNDTLKTAALHLPVRQRGSRVVASRFRAVRPLDRRDTL